MWHHWRDIGPTIMLCLACVAWIGLCLACFAWLALLGLHQGKAADALAHVARLQPRVKLGGGAATLLW